MEVKELINKISSIEKEIYNYIVNTEHWIFYWIANKEVQDFIKTYPEDYDDRVYLQVRNISTTPSFVIKFDDHPNDVKLIERYAVLYTFRDIVKAKWLEWNGKVEEIPIQDKEKELAYHKEKVNELKKELLELKNVIQEDKDLLLKDLSTRLPYSVKCCIFKEIPEWFKKQYGATKDLVKVDFTLDVDTFSYVIKNYDGNFKPYLRSMSSMTNEEVLEYISLKESIVASDGITYSFETRKSIDWLNAHHFDYRGLIKKGLAIEVTEENNPYK